MSKKIENAVYELVKPYADQLGFEVIDVEFTARKDADNELIIYIDKPGGVDLDDCESLSRAIDEPMDIADPIPDKYILCVSSPGIDRPLKNDRDLERSLGQEVDLKLYKKLNGAKEFVGILKAYDAETVTFTIKNEDLSVNKSDIALIRLHISF